MQYNAGLVTLLGTGMNGDQYVIGLRIAPVYMCSFLYLMPVSVNVHIDYNCRR